MNYKPITSKLERDAYAAAYKISKLTDLGQEDLACPGARNSRRIDQIAGIILESMKRKRKNG